MKDINLMPDETKTSSSARAEKGKKGINPAKAIAVAVLILVIAGGSILSPKIYVKGLEAQASSIQSELDSDKYAEVKKINSEIGNTQTSIDTKENVIENISVNSFKVTDIFNYVQQAVPKGVTVVDLQCGEKNMSISGTAKDSTAVAEYISNLSRIEAFAGYTSKATFSYDKANVTLSYKLDFSRVGQEG